MPEPVSSIAIGGATFALILSLVQSASLYFNPPHTIQYDYDYDLERIDLDHKIDVDIPEPGLDLSFSQYGRTSRRHSLTPTADLDLDLDRAEHLSDVSSIHPLSSPRTDMFFQPFSPSDRGYHLNNNNRTPSIHSMRSGHSLGSGYSVPTQATSSSVMSSPHFTHVRSRRVDVSAGFNMLLTIMGESRHGSIQ
ncbi:hypothetical protein BG006_008566 [Podila minutissima]|uniref:Uncharacterized protein n=1 Tax=Podila minutissima TaxID=64525 RepID=A0A9P5SII3_9FUNG|nr:hypothetical protein BG006_008566 [Podila minutissima]